MEQRVVEVAYNNKIGHIGSCLTTVPIVDYIYKTKKKDDIVVLSSGHAGMKEKMRMLSTRNTEFIQIEMLKMESTSLRGP